MYRKDIPQDNLNAFLPLALQPIWPPPVMAAEATATRVTTPSESGIFHLQLLYNILRRHLGSKLCQSQHLTTQLGIFYQDTSGFMSWLWEKILSILIFQLLDRGFFFL